ncbi:Prolyl tripeptidyl peptidase precursor [Gammaproteobacteria bacterium MOLA455]|nr:Prolyl tripeptidyl peptidase precursor [Gammaproteobacteria bacterium MOLA455]
MTLNQEKPRTAQDNTILARYRRAEALEHESVDGAMVSDALIRPNWIGDSDQFWYTRSTHDKGTEYRLVNAKTANNTVAFDHKRLATALADATGETVSESALPISNLDFCDAAVSFNAFDTRWQFDGELKTVKSLVTYPDHWLVSPDGTNAAFVKDYNLWLRDLNTGEERALTHDGQPHYAYAVQTEGRDLVGDFIGPEPLVKPEALWSPDSSQLFTVQMDERRVRDLPSMLYVPQDGTLAPQVKERKYALPGDKEVVQYRVLVIDVTTGIETEADYPPIADSFVWLGPFSGNRAWWSGDSNQAYFIDMTRGQKTARVIGFDTASGKCHCLFEESSSTYVELGLDFEHPSMLMPLPETSELLWFSERSGWGHLYLYDLTTGELKNPVTSGNFLVRGVLHYDSQNRALLIQIAGRESGKNPYYRELAKVNIDSGEMTLVVASDHDYSLCHFTKQNAGVSPNGHFAVVTRSRVDEAPVTELYDRSGRHLLTVETADVSGLPSGWQWPEPFTAKADDGETDVYGVLFRPSHFDSDKQYPVLDLGVTIPFYSLLPTGAFLDGGVDPIGNIVYMTCSALAELGFMVTVIDGRGTPYRSKAFHDFGYNDFMQSGGMVDHVASIKQLAERYPSMDLESVGIVSTDAPGNGAVFGLLNYPDFYKVGVAFSMWDPRLVKQGEVYHGIIDETARQQPIWDDAVQNMQGKLLLVSGFLDQFFHISMTFQLVDALGKANKDVDLLMQPNGGHGWRVKHAHRRVWDYLVRHLQGVEPPKEFELITAGERMMPEMMSEVVAGR